MLRENQYFPTEDYCFSVERIVEVLTFVSHALNRQLRRQTLAKAEDEFLEWLFREVHNEKADSWVMYAKCLSLGKAAGPTNSIVGEAAGLPKTGNVVW